MYNNIGGKIKVLAIVIGIVEAVSAVITGMVLCSDSYMVGSGFLTMLLGPVVAWISSWFLYAFGELVEKTSENEANTREIVNLLRRGAQSPATIRTQVPVQPIRPQPAAPVAPNAGRSGGNVGQTATVVDGENGKVRCSICNTEQPANRKVCWNCGAKFKEKLDPTAPYWCDTCGHPGPYDDRCPKCNSSVKRFNMNIEQ